RVVPPRERRHDPQVGRAGDRQELCQPLDRAQDDGLESVHAAAPAAAVARALPVAPAAPVALAAAVAPGAAVPPVPPAGSGTCPSTPTPVATLTTGVSTACLSYL